MRKRADELGHGTSFGPARLHAEADWRHFVVAIRDGGVIGWMRAEGESIAHLHVDPACWNGGAGSALLAIAERQAARAGATTLLEVRLYPGTESGSPVETIEMRKDAGA